MTLPEYNSCVDKFSDGIYRFVLSNIRNEEKAKDIVQDVFEKVWNKVNTIHFEKAKSYLFTTANSCIIDTVRKDKFKSNDDVNLHEPMHSQQYNDLNEILHEALNKLPQIQKSSILLRDYEGYNYKEIGDILNLSEAQVKVYIYRGRKQLQKYLVAVDVLI